MKNLWQFILKNIHLLLFILLEVVAFLLLTANQPYLRSTFFSSANRLVAECNQAGDNVVAYFRLRRENEELNQQIAQLQVQVQSLTNQIESVRESADVNDSTVYRYAHLGYQMIPARVIDITTHQQHNSLTLNKGSRDGISMGMGVIAGTNIVGIVSQVNECFALVVPVIHTSVNVSARIKKNSQIGFTNWKGHDADHVSLMEIGRHVQVEQGDTIVTSGMTSTFPEGVLIGAIDKIRLSDGDNYYQIRVRLATDFHDLRYVQVLDNTFQPQIRELINE